MSEIADKAKRLAHLVLLRSAMDQMFDDVSTETMCSHMAEYRTIEKDMDTLSEEILKIIPKE